MLLEFKVNKYIFRALDNNNYSYIFFDMINLKKRIAKYIVFKSIIRYNYTVKICKTFYKIYTKEVQK